MGFPYLKIEKLPNFRFMFFERYEIHIQAFAIFMDNLSSSVPYLHKIVFKIYTHLYITNIWKTETTNLKRKNKHMVPRTYIFPNCPDFFEPRIDNNTSQDDSIIFLYR